MLQPEQHLGACRLIERVGAGGMGEVWKGEDTRLGRIVAIKVLPPAVAADAEATARLRREARTAAQLYHPNIAMIHAIEQEGDRLFIVMEFVEGEPLSRVIATRGALSEADLCRIGRGVADALAAAHEKGIVHRDIKPDNIIVNGARVKVLDFGIAKQVGPVPTTSASDAPTTFLTQQGMILGTVHYMSPEQALGKPLDARTDLFSLGVVLYEGATGRLPFQGETATETMMHIIRDEPEDAARVNPKVSAGMKAIIERCLRKNREERFATAAELGLALEQQLGVASTAPYTRAATARAAAPTVLTGSKLRTVQETPPRRAGMIWIAAGVVVVAAALALAFAARRSAAPAQAPVVTTTAPLRAATSTVAPAASTATVNVTAAPPPPPPQIVEKVETKAVPEPAASEPATAQQSDPKSEPSADAVYQRAVSQLASGDWPEARKTLERTLLLDAHYAKAHFRLGEIAMFNRNFRPALVEYRAAMADRDRLDPRERHLTRLGMAVASGNHEEARKIGREIERQWPGDPDLARVVAEFGGEAPPRPLRPRWRRQP